MDFLPKTTNLQGGDTPKTTNLANHDIHTEDKTPLTTTPPNPAKHVKPTTRWTTRLPPTSTPLNPPNHTKPFQSFPTKIPYGYNH